MDNGHSIALEAINQSAMQGAEVVLTLGRNRHAVMAWLDVKADRSESPDAFLPDRTYVGPDWRVTVRAA